VLSACACDSFFFFFSFEEFCVGHRRARAGGRPRPEAASRRHVFRSGPAAAGRKVRSVAGSVAPRAGPPINPSPRGVHWASEAHSLGAAGCTHWPTHSADISFSSPPRPSPRPSAAPPGRSDPSIQEPEGERRERTIRPPSSDLLPGVVFAPRSSPVTIRAVLDLRFFLSLVVKSFHPPGELVGSFWSNPVPRA